VVITRPPRKPFVVNNMDELDAFSEDSGAQCLTHVATLDERPALVTYTAQELAVVAPPGVRVTHAKIPVAVLIHVVAW